MSFEYFHQCVSSGFPGLCITRKTPYEIVSKYDLGGAEYRNIEGEAGYRPINPQDLGQIENAIEEFATENEKPVFLIDGFDYLIALNSIDKVMGFLERIRHTLEEHGGSLLTSLDLGTFNSRESTRIATCFDEVK
ncbi:MAG: DUF835 domain-containing protein [Thermoplasmata archaeon]